MSKISSARKPSINATYEQEIVYTGKVREKLSPYDKKRLRQRPDASCTTPTKARNRAATLTDEEKKKHVMQAGSKRTHQKAAFAQEPTKMDLTSDSDGAKFQSPKPTKRAKRTKKVERSSPVVTRNLSSSRETFNSIVTRNSCYLRK